MYRGGNCRHASHELIVEFVQGYRWLGDGCPCHSNCSRSNRVTQSAHCAISNSGP